MTYSTYPSLLILTWTLAACGGGAGESADSETAGNAFQVQASGNAAVSNTTEADADVVAAVTPAPASPSTDTATTPTPISSPAASPAPSPTPSPYPGTTKKIVEYYGDSTVWGYKSSEGGQVAKPAPVAFAEALPDPSAYDVRNEGISGTTACQLLNGTDGRHPAWANQMAGSNATYVFVNHAINDQWKYDVSTYKSCLTSLARTARQYGKQIIFETPNPTRDSGSGGLDVYVNAMKEVAANENVPVVDQYKYLTDYLQGKSAYTICPDGLHPSASVYIMKGKYAAGAFASLFQ